MTDKIKYKKLLLYLIFILAAYLLDFCDYIFPPDDILSYPVTLQTITAVVVLIFMAGGFFLAASVHVGIKLCGEKAFLAVVLLLTVLDVVLLNRLLYHSDPYFTLMILGSHVYLLFCTLFASTKKNWK